MVTSPNESDLKDPVVLVSAVKDGQESVSGCCALDEAADTILRT